MKSELQAGPTGHQMLTWSSISLLTTSTTRDTTQDMSSSDSSTPRRAEFSLSVPDSEPSTRAPSPAPDGSEDHSHIYFTDSNSFLHPTVEKEPPGRQARDVYDTVLSPWRAAIRRKILKNVKRESKMIARMQVCCRYRAA